MESSLTYLTLMTIIVNWVRGQLDLNNTDILIRYTIEISPNFTGFFNNISQKRKRENIDPYNGEWLVNPDFEKNDTTSPLCYFKDDSKGTYSKYSNQGVALSFIAVGDTGGTELKPFTTKIGRDVALSLGKFAEANEPKFILMLGDNFYPRGVMDIYDTRFDTSFEDLYNYTSLNIPWYILAGGHDHYGNISAQLVYQSVKWHFPDLIYSKTFTIPLDQNVTLNDSKPFTVTVVMIDTQVMCPTKKYYGKALERGKFINAANKEYMWKSLEEMLAISSSDMLIVCGHQPVFSVAKHGPTPCLTRRLRPLLYKYNVSLYLSGHDHVLEHLQDQNDTTGQIMNYVIIGSGSKTNVNRRTDRLTSPLCLEKFYYEAKGGFGVFDVLQGKRLRISFFNKDDEMLYQFHISPRF